MNFSLLTICLPRICFRSTRETHVSSVEGVVRSTLYQSSLHPLVVPVQFRDGSTTTAVQPGVEISFGCQKFLCGSWTLRLPSFELLGLAQTSRQCSPMNGSQRISPEAKMGRKEGWSGEGGGKGWAEWGGAPSRCQAPPTAARSGAEPKG